MSPSPIPAPGGAPAGQEPGPGPGGGFASPAPAIHDSQAANALQSSLTIVANARRLSEQFPQVTPEVRQINDLVQRIQAKIKAGQQPAQTQAPPV